MCAASSFCSCLPSTTRTASSAPTAKRPLLDYVAKATPLSRFLVESARDGCDLSTAEGRARMASNAKPLWNQLPDGALKLQLLSEIAQLVQLGSTELGTLWAHGTAKPALRQAPRRKREAAPAAEFGRTASTLLMTSRQSFSEPWIPQERMEKENRVEKRRLDTPWQRRR